jgi:adenosylmethionine-8-amino-7-oxononanoate aminotransferase
MTHVIHREPQTRLPIAMRADGVYIFDQSGKRYLDACGGAAVSCLGHGHPQLIDAIKRQAETLAYAHTGFFSNDPMERLAEKLAQRSPANLNHVQFVCGGSEGVEAALKMARQYHVEKGETKRINIIARRRSFHGSTFAALGVGESVWRKAPFMPMLRNAEQIAPCYEYRNKNEEESSYTYGQRVANELESAIEKLGPETVAAFIAEPVVGATLGAVTPVEGYFKRIREICDRYGVLLIFDEVMCGMGRTGTLFACEQEGVTPDILVIAKGLAAGYQPIGAVLAREEIYQAFLDGSGKFLHGHTFMGHPIACAAGNAVLEVIEQEDLLQNVRERGRQLKLVLHQRLGDHPFVGDIRGRGLFVGLEIVQDRKTKQPFDPSLNQAAKIKKAAMALGLMCYPGGGTADGYQGDHVLLAPPYIATAAEIDLITERICEAIDIALETKVTPQRLTNVAR